MSQNKICKEGNNGLLSFIPDGNRESIINFVNALKYFQWGCRWGGWESLVMPIGVDMEDETLEMCDIPKNFVRLHIGLEDIDTLIEDLDNVLKLLL